MPACCLKGALRTRRPGGTNSLICWILLVRRTSGVENNGDGYQDGHDGHNDEDEEEEEEEEEEDNDEDDHENDNDKIGGDADDADAHGGGEVDDNSGHNGNVTKTPQLASEGTSQVR